MESNIDAALIRQSYERLTDDAFIQRLRAMSDGASLTAEAREIVMEEVKRRNFEPALVQKIKDHLTLYSDEELEDYCALIRRLPCPVTGRRDAPLNATLIAEVASFIFLTQHTTQLLIACPEVLDRANNKAIQRTMLIGWWAIPWGIIRTVEAIRSNIRSKKTNHSATPNKYLRDFVLSRIVDIKACKDKEEKLSLLIAPDKQPVQ